MAQKMNLIDKDPKVTPEYTFEFMPLSRIEELNNITVESAGSHFLGSEIARKAYLLDQLYCYKEPVAPGSSATKTMFRKPVIYTSVKKIEKYLKNQVKAGVLPVESACSEYNKVLDVALSIINLNTNSFENRIKATTGADELLNVYINEVKLETIN